MFTIRENEDGLGGPREGVPCPAPPSQPEKPKAQSHPSTKEESQSLGLLGSGLGAILSFHPIGHDSSWNQGHRKLSLLHPSLFPSLCLPASFFLPPPSLCPHPHLFLPFPPPSSLSPLFLSLPIYLSPTFCRETPRVLSDPESGSQPEWLTAAAPIRSFPLPTPTPLLRDIKASPSW
ncbi:hypothetical protein mRhiFer1_008604 [Rhinolophus ferrumequinum]|uniref:Uncharacterized protein n=1 Tax=Rhinolophus ferrumequinum TaxID=59479 RepID=A0A7J7U0U4_RHIFE|nr:hypothetical protein mRhiFer1_008604 [Rhinolophus ferrumequinum]